MRIARASKSDIEEKKIIRKSRSPNIKILFNIRWNQLKPEKSIFKNNKHLLFFTLQFFKKFMNLRERERREDGERETERNTDIAVPPIDEFIGWFLHVPWPGIKPATLAYGDSTLTNWATGPELLSFVFISNNCIKLNIDLLF